MEQQRSGALAHARRVGRWLAAAAGLWAAATALGGLAAFGPMRIIRGDAGPLNWAAAAATAGLLVALGVAGWRAGRRWWGRILVFALGLVLVAALASPAAVAVWATHPAHPALTAEPPAGAQELTVPCGDATLAAWYLPGTNGAAVVLAHGAGSTRGATIDQALVLAEGGYGVLLIDARGHGDSTGAAMDLGWWGEADLACAVDALIAQPGVDAERVSIVGLSMGAESAIGAAGADARVAAVVAEGATARTAEDKDGWLPGGLAGGVQRLLDAERDLFTGALTDAPHPGTLRDAAATSQAPMLLITAGTMPSEADAAAWIADGNPRVQVWTIEGAAHTGGLDAALEQWRSRVVSFLDEALGGQSREPEARG